MPYSTKLDVQTWGQFTSNDFGATGYDENATYQMAINVADRMIDDYCNAPEGMFESEGVEIQREYHDGVDVIYIGGIIKFFNWYYGATSHLKLKHRPVLSVTKLEEETSPGAWTTRTEGANSDYIVVEDGVRFVQNTPAWKYKNVRVTYKVGYKTTPHQITNVSARLAATILRRIIEAKDPRTSTHAGVSVGVAEEASLTRDVFTDELKVSLNNFRRAKYGFS